MVSKNFVNLLEEFQRLKNYDLIIFTTYSFDALFFDNVLLRILRQNNPNSQIIIFIDSKHYPKSDESTESTGVEYVLIQIPQSVFHPKLFLFYSKKASVAYIGSHNLTLSGLSHNLELSCKLKNEKVITDCLEYVLLTLRRVFEENNLWIRKIEEILKEKASIELENNIRLLHNLDLPILQKTLNIIKGKKKKILKATIIVPFFSGEKHLLNKIHSIIKPEEIAVCIQKHNHNLDANEVIGLPYVSVKEVIPKENRTIHSKLILFEAQDENFLLMGSPNFTLGALDKIAGVGNFEIALFLNLQDKGLFQELKFKNIEIDDVIKTRRIEDTTCTTETKKYDVFIIISYLDILNRLVLDVKTNIEEKEFTLNIHHPSKEKRKVPVKIGQSSTNIIIPVAGEIFSGSSIWLTDDTGKTVSNTIRIYNPSEQGLITKHYGSLTEIPELIASSKGLEEMLHILAALFTPEKTEHISPDRKYSVSGPSPGRIISKGAPEDILETIKYLLRIPRTKPVGPRTEHGRGSSQIVMIESPEVMRPINLDDEIPKMIEKFTKAFEVRKLTKNNSPLMYSIYILVVLKLLEFVTTRKRNDMLSRQIANLSRLLDNYGISKEKQEGEILTFLSILAHVQTEISGSWYNVISTLKTQIEPILFSVDDPLKGLQFADKIPEYLEKAKLNPAKNKGGYHKAIASIISRIVAEKSLRIQSDYVKKLTDQMLFLSGPRADHRKALFVFWILRKILVSNRHLKQTVRSMIPKIQKLRGFRETLAKDILNT